MWVHLQLVLPEDKDSEWIVEENYLTVYVHLYSMEWEFQFSVFLYKIKREGEVVSDKDLKKTPKNSIYGPLSTDICIFTYFTAMKKL